MITRLRRGFKADAERKSIAIRKKLGLKSTDRLDCFVLAKTLEITIVSLVDLEQCGAKHRSVRILRDRRNHFSALTICGENGQRLIIFNPDESTGRNANSVAHELSHAILLHPPTPALDVGGCRKWDGEAEAQADWLAAALLVPREGALLFILRGVPLEQIAKHFGVSLQLLNWRIRITGINRQVDYFRKARA